MRGICGVFNANSQSEVQAMVQKLSHRGPDGAGSRDVILEHAGQEISESEFRREHEQQFSI